MYGAAWRNAFDGHFHDWPAWRGEETMGHLAERIITEHHIKQGDTIIGTSLGGMIACEIAILIELKQIVLIGSAQSKEDVSQILSILHPLIALAPIPFLQMASGKLPGALAEMFAHSDPAFIRNMSKAIFKWEGLKREVPVLRIHGIHDAVIPMPKGTKHAIGGGHLIVMTHPLECIEAVKAERVP